MEIMDFSWYAKTVNGVFEALSTRKSGLNEQEAEERQIKFGLNKLPQSKTDSTLIIFLRQFQSPLIYILFIASLIVFFMREFIDASIILVTLFFNAIVGTIQEGKARDTLTALKKFSETETKVLRNGEEAVIPDYEVVPGDIVILEEGDKVPADARIINSHNITVDESALTGESVPVHKFAEALKKENLETSEQNNMVFKGTSIVAGNGEAVVVSTGVSTVLGEISREISVIDTEIPLKANIRYLTRAIIIAVFTICGSIFFLGLYFGNSVRQMFATVVSLAVSIVPEGLPIVMTLVLATGVWRMSKRNALVKKLQAVEALGQAKVIAVDKTGTLTKNEVVLQKLYVNSKVFSVSGDGYEPFGEVFLQDELIDPKRHHDLMLAGKIGAYGTNDGIVFDNESKQWQAIGDPTESAISTFAQKLGFNNDDVLDKDSFRLSEIPFDYKNKFHAAVNKIKDEVFTTVIGAPEVILEQSDKIWHDGRNIELTKQKREELEAVFTQMSKEGLRVLAFAQMPDAPEHIQKKDVGKLSFVGYYGLKDALRPEVFESVRQAQVAGVRVVMITGDHILTAEAIAREAGIFHDGEKVLTGEEINSLSEDELSDILEGVSVFARVTPEHKLKIVRAYQKLGLTIAMTGDGVNDAPSLVAADLGIAMGKIGTEVAKEASDIVLLDDNFKSIISAIEEGRNIYKTIKKVILYLFSTNMGEVFTITGALLLGLPLPVLAAQIVWLNLVTDGFLDVALAMEPKEDDLLERNFVHPKKYLLDNLTIFRMFVMAAPMTLGSIYLFNMFYQIDLIKAWTVSLTVLAMFQWFNAWNCRHERKSIFQTNLFSNKFLVGATIIVVVLQLLAIYNPILEQILNTTPLSLSDWLLIIPVAFSIIIVEEIRKFFQRRFA